MKKWSLVYATMVALIGAALVIASSSGPDVAPARLPGPRLAAPTVTASPLNAQAGNFTSAIEIGGTGTTQIGGTAIDSSGNLYVTGGFSGNIVFNTSPQTTLTSTQDDDLFVAKYDASGHPLWARVANGATGLPAGLSLDGGLSLAVDAQGNSYVGGGFVKTLAFKDANNNTLATLNSSGDRLNFELFVAKYNPNGTLLWAVGGMSGSPQHATDLLAGANGITDIVVDGLGNPYVAGTFAGTNFLGTPVSQPALHATGVLVSRLDPATGTPVWVSAFGQEGGSGVMGLGIDSAANLYVMGELFFTTTFPTQPTPTTLANDDGQEDAFVAKYNQNGQLLWVKQIGGSMMIFGSHLAVNGAGQIYLTGEFDGTVTFGSTTLNDSKSGAGDAGMAGFLAKLDTDGQTWLWARGFSAEGERVTLDGSGNPSLTGAFFDQAVFGAENPPTSQTLTSLGDEDQYLAKYDAAGNFQFAKALPGDGESSENIIDSANVQVKVVPIRLLYNPATCRLHVSGDFSGTLMLDNLTLDSGADRHGFVAELESLFGLTPRIKAFPANGGSSSLKVSAGCNSTWTAVSNNPDVVNPTSLPGGMGDGMVSYQVLANSAAGRRAGTMTVAGQTFTVLQGANFQDVAQDHPFYSFIGKFSAYGITSGCGSGNYCPDRSLRRDELAIFLIRALGETPSATQHFTDVPPGSFGYGEINRLFELHITAGCGSGNYCPSQNLPRDQAAILIIRALGATPSTTQHFTDVPPGSFGFGEINRMSELGITAGCGGGNFCPGGLTTRGQIAVFLVRAFGL